MFQITEHMKTISVKDLKYKLDNEKIQLIDVREPYEFAICALPKSINIPMGELSDRYDEIKRDIEVYISCKSGKRAEAVANFLETEYSYDKVTIVEGGIIAYIEEVDSSLEVY